MPRHSPTGRRPGPVTLAHPDTYRSRPLAGQPVLVWLVVTLAIAVSAGAYALDQLSRTEPAPDAEVSSIEMVRLSPYVGGYLDEDGTAHTVRVATRSRGNRTPAQALPIRADIQVTTAPDGTVTRAWYGRDMPTNVAPWVVALAASTTLAATFATATLVVTARRRRHGGTRGRIDANIALLLDPFDTPPDPDPAVKIAAVLADDQLTPRVEPWYRPDRDGDTPATVTLHAGWYAWLLPAMTALTAPILAGACVQAFPGDRSVAVTAAAVLTVVSLVLATAVPVALKLTVHEDGTLVRRTLLGRRRFPLAELAELVGWEWTTHSGPRLRMAPTRLWLRARGGTTLLLPLAGLARTRQLAPVLRHWAETTGAAVSGDLAYALGSVPDPRQPPPAPLRPTGDLAWLEHPRRRAAGSARTVAAALVAFTFALAPAGATWHVAHLLEDRDGTTRPLLVDPCDALTDTGATVTADHQQVGGMFSGCTAEADGRAITVWTTPSAALYVELLTNAHADGVSYVAVDEGWAEQHGAVQAHVTVADDGRVSLAAMTYAGSVRVFDDHLSVEMVAATVHALDQLNRRPIDSDHRAFETRSAIRSLLERIPDSPSPDAARAASTAGLPTSEDRTG